MLTANDADARPVKSGRSSCRVTAYCRSSLVESAAQVANGPQEFIKTAAVFRAARSQGHQHGS